jgi:transposase-like protein
MISFDIHHASWVPPHCPNPKCKYHNHLHGPWPFKRFGYYRRQARPQRIRRFRCNHCLVTFSSQTFSTTYYLKRPDVLAKLLTKTTGCMANRQLADDINVAPSTVDGQLYRLGRHCLLLHKQLQENLRQPTVIAVDGFESFELSQYHPFHFHVAVDCHSALFLGFTDSPLRRKGAMTACQRRRRQELEDRFGRPDPQAVRKDMAELLANVVQPGSKVTIRSDLHKSYPRAIGQIPAQITHEVVPSKDPRGRHNVLYELNLLDSLIRHGSANHKRETIAWAKRRQGAAMRLMVFLVWRNYVRQRWRKQVSGTPAMQAGLLNRPLTVDEILEQRIFVSKAGLKGRWSQYYWGEVETPALGVNRRHALKRAI